ncbi:MICOS complex subunit MIC25 isoform 1-T1 [Glossophaga mutica]
MGGTESSEGRRLSFGMDEEERVRVLQGIRLSENVVNRMKDSNQPSNVDQLTFPPAPPPSTLGTSKGPEKDSKLPRSKYGGSQPPSGVEEDLLKRYKQEQAVIQDELFQVVMREREAATKYQSAFLHRGEGSVDQEKQKSALLNAEMYKLSSQQFHEAASKMEGTIKQLPKVMDVISRRVRLQPLTAASRIYPSEEGVTREHRPHRLQPVCSGLQAQILRCYNDHLHEVLLCSDLVKAYQHCVTTAHKG